MSFYIIESEHDIDIAVKECVKLMSLDRARVKLAFNTMGMVRIFMQDLTDECVRYDIDPESKDFHMDVLVDIPSGDEEAYDIE